MEVAPKNTETTKKWGKQGSLVNGTLSSLGTGKNNTELIYNKMTSWGETDTAVQYCKNLVVGGYDGWFLPSLDEYKRMRTELYNNSLGQFLENELYTTSTEYDADNAKVYSFLNGGENQFLKSVATNRYIRAVRRF